jgi:transposase
MPGVTPSNDLKDRIVRWYYEDPDTTRCSIGTVSNDLYIYQECGEVKDLLRQYTGRPSKLSEADLKFLDTIIAANPALYLDEIQQKLRDVQEVLNCNSR